MSGVESDELEDSSTSVTSVFTSGMAGVMRRVCWPTTAVASLSPSSFEESLLAKNTQLLEGYLELNDTLFNLKSESSSEARKFLLTYYLIYNDFSKRTKLLTKIRVK